MAAGRAEAYFCYTLPESAPQLPLASSRDGTPQQRFAAYPLCSHVGPTRGLFVYHKNAGNGGKGGRQLFRESRKMIVTLRDGKSEIGRDANKADAL